MFHSDITIVIDSVYKINVDPDPNYAEKLAKAIEMLGDKYLLAQPVERLKDEYKR